ncbi:DgyrCDS735 [Dimorphilus gyrociliatus]|uniref:DgyrCDS735 n=1 Tax=Dimorphilus gyrociliatus TaxID=2664684 RepID=A0A7I8V723_9ANNE|nr:DgyrCDS735 [Dimorphilus gyrociliatus]
MGLEVEESNTAIQNEPETEIVQNFENNEEASVEETVADEEQVESTEAESNQDEVEEEEEEELEDPLDSLKESCGESSACASYKAELDKCTERVTSHPETTENCSQELYDFMHCVDKCVSKQLFSKLK